MTFFLTEYAWAYAADIFWYVLIQISVDVPIFFYLCLFRYNYVVGGYIYQYFQIFSDLYSQLKNVGDIKEKSGNIGHHQKKIGKYWWKLEITGLTVDQCLFKLI